MDAEAFEATPARWLSGPRDKPAGRYVALDCKTLRGSRSGPGSQKGEAPGVHLLTAYAPEEARVLSQEPVDGKTNEHKASLQLLKITPLKWFGRHGRRDVLPPRLLPRSPRAGGRLSVTVKDNQANLKQGIALALGEPPEGSSPYEVKKPLASRESATSIDKGHGRLERRMLTATPLLNDYRRRRGWPEVGQVFRGQRERTIRGETSVEVAYGLTSLSPEQASPGRLLALVRGHWAIENYLHHLGDVTLGEYALRARCGATPQVLAALRNLVLQLLEQVDAPSTVAALRRIAPLPHLAIQAPTLSR